MAAPRGAKTWRSQGQLLRIERSTISAPSRSCTSAECTTAPTINPSFPTVICRLRPLISFPASKPRGPPLLIIFTHRLSIAPAEGLDPSFQFARRHHQPIVDGAQKAAVAPVVKVSLNDHEGCEVPRQQAPLTAGHDDVLDRAHHVPQVGRAQAA
jgi:hypothetical protein